MRVLSRSRAPQKHKAQFAGRTSWRGPRESPPTIRAVLGATSIKQIIRPHPLALCAKAGATTTRGGLKAGARCEPQVPLRGAISWTRWLSHTRGDSHGSPLPHPPAQITPGTTPGRALARPRRKINGLHPPRVPGEPCPRRGVPWDAVNVRGGIVERNQPSCALVPNCDAFASVV